MTRIAIAFSLLFAVGCSVDAEDPADEHGGIGVTPPVGGGPGPVQRSCDELVECLLRAAETGQQTCALHKQDALEDAERAVRVCEYAAAYGEDQHQDCLVDACEE